MSCFRTKHKKSRGNYKLSRYFPLHSCPSLIVVNEDQAVIDTSRFCCCGMVYNWVKQKGRRRGICAWRAVYLTWKRRYLRSTYQSLPRHLSKDTGMEYTWTEWEEERIEKKRNQRTLHDKWVITHEQKGWQKSKATCSFHNIRSMLAK